MLFTPAVVFQGVLNCSGSCMVPILLHYIVYAAEERTLPNVIGLA
jgi:hypothetical protein